MDKIIKRTIQERVENKLFKGKVVIIYGARQVGKTTLVKQLQKKFDNTSVYLNCDEPDIRKAFTNQTSTEMKSFIGDKKLVILDEAQRVENIGLSLKLLVDNHPDMQIVATGSSSFDLSNKITEPLTGRKYEFYLQPFSLSELGELYEPAEINRLIDKRVVLGMYPEIVQTGDMEAKDKLTSITKSYLYKDVLQYQDIRNPELLEKLLQALALQVGSEVSYSELANMLDINKKTVASYIRILEQAFIIFTLKPFSRNLRNELKKMRKIYFYDTGLRNALISNLNPLDLRQDRGALWENFLISERRKQNNNTGKDIPSYFWRTHQQQEIDYLEEENSILHGYEFKWSIDSYRPPRVFLDAYPNSSVKLITRDNIKDFIA